MMGGRSFLSKCVKPERNFAYWYNNSFLFILQAFLSITNLLEKNYTNRIRQSWKAKGRKKGEKKDKKVQSIFTSVIIFIWTTVGMVINTFLCWWLSKIHLFYYHRKQISFTFCLKHKWLSFSSATLHLWKMCYCKFMNNLAGGHKT